MVCAISPRRESRNEIRTMLSQDGRRLAPEWMFGELTRSKKCGDENVFVFS